MFCFVKFGIEDRNIILITEKEGKMNLNRVLSSNYSFSDDLKMIDELSVYVEKNLEITLLRSKINFQEF